jgi:hypothetical protein
MADVVSWVALSCATVGLLLVALVPSMTARMWRTDAVELRRFGLFKEVLTANMCARARSAAAAGPAPAVRIVSAPGSAGQLPAADLTDQAVAPGR